MHCRDVRESLEAIDKDLSNFYADLDNSENLIIKSEDDLFDDLKLLREKLKHRGDIIMQFAQNLDDTENMRADVASKELKTLVDKLIGIAHQLPDEIGTAIARLCSALLQSYNPFPPFTFRYVPLKCVKYKAHCVLHNQQWGICNCCVIFDVSICAFPIMRCLCMYVDQSTSWRPRPLS